MSVLTVEFLEETMYSLFVCLFFVILTSPFLNPSFLHLPYAAFLPTLLCASHKGGLVRGDCSRESKGEVGYCRFFFLLKFGLLRRDSGCPLRIHTFVSSRLYVLSK